MLSNAELERLRLMAQSTWKGATGDALIAQAREANRLRGEVEGLRLLQGNGEHPEDKCQKCGGRNISWFVRNETWNAVAGSEGGILCPICFAAAYADKFPNEGHSWQLHQVDWLGLPESTVAAINAFVARATSAVESKAALSEENAQLRTSLAALEAKAGLADEYAAQIREDMRLKVLDEDLLPQFERDWLTRHAALEAQPKDAEAGEGGVGG